MKRLHSCEDNSQMLPCEAIGCIYTVCPERQSTMYSQWLRPNNSKPSSTCSHEPISPTPSSDIWTALANGNKRSRTLAESTVNTTTPSNSRAIVVSNSDWMSDLQESLLVSSSQHISNDENCCPKTGQCSTSADRSELITTPAGRKLARKRSENGSIISCGTPSSVSSTSSASSLSSFGNSTDSESLSSPSSPIVRVLSSIPPDIREMLVEMQGDKEFTAIPDPSKITLRLSLKGRVVMLDKIGGLCNRFRVLFETRLMAITIMDRYLTLTSEPINTTGELHSFSYVCFMLACKFQEIDTKINYKRICYDNKLSNHDKNILIRAEEQVLRTLGYDLYAPTVALFALCIMSRLEIDLESIEAKLIMCICERSQLDARVVVFPPSVIANVAVGLILSERNEEYWAILELDSTWNADCHRGCLRAIQRSLLEELVMITPSMHCLCTSRPKASTINAVDSNVCLQCHRLLHSRVVTAMSNIPFSQIRSISQRYGKDVYDQLLDIKADGSSQLEAVMSALEIMDM